ncbi:MAG TPA: 5'-methylthioadenosine/adenosylhomocysteine nucleosidase [Mycobacterium sp.]|nr:5'-methylthioadenosine/adenosylhomocysteine nucleosidase [Mycobacterium sp.]
MTIGLICAIPQELAHLQEVLDTERVTDAAHTRFAEGYLDGHRVVLVGAGMGKVNAAVVTTLLADRFGCRAVVFSGVAGGLDPGLAIGDVVIADRVVQCDAGSIEDERLAVYQAGHVVFFNPTDRLGYDADAVLLNRVKDRLDGFELPPLLRHAGGQNRPPRIVYDTVLTGDQYLHCEVTRARLHADLGGAAIEMEGGAVAQACESFGLPWLVIRALSDLAGRESVLDFTAFSDGVAAVSATILRHLLAVV